MKKYLSILLAVLFILLVTAGCGSTATDTKTTTAASTAAPSASAATETTAPEAMDTTPITFTVFDQDANPNNDNYQSDVSKEILKQTGVTLKIEYPVGDAEQKVSLIAASGSYPDMMYVTHQRDLFVQNGAFLKLDDLIEKYGPDIKKMFGSDITRLHYSLDDKSIYNLGTFGINALPNAPETGFSVQYGVLKELGYPKVETVQDFEAVIKQYVEKHPTYNGKPTIGVSLIADDWLFMIGIRNPAMMATGKPDDGDWYVDRATGKTILALRTPEEKEYFRWLNHMNDIGLLDKESFVQKQDQYLAKIASGRVVGLIDAVWDYQSALGDFAKNNMVDRGYLMFPSQLTKDTKSQVMRDPGFRGDWGISITKDCKDPERVMKFLNWMCTEKAQILFNWGIEGTHYTIQNGQRVLNPDLKKQKNEDITTYRKTTGIELYNQRPWPFYGWGTKDSTGQLYSYDTLDELASGYLPPHKDALAAYGGKYDLDLYPKTADLEKSPYGIAWQMDFEAGSPDKVIMQKYQDLYHKRIPQAVLAKPADFDKIWDGFQKELIDAGVEQAEADFTKLIQTKMQLYTGK